MNDHVQVESGPLNVLPQPALAVSLIHGTLQANGNVYLINPNGILVGPGANINVGSLIASTLDVPDSLLSTVQMPRGVPVGTLAIGKAGAVNAALLAGQILGLKHTAIHEAVKADRERRRQESHRPPGAAARRPRSVSL